MVCLFYNKISLSNNFDIKSMNDKDNSLQYHETNESKVVKTIKSHFKLGMEHFFFAQKGNTSEYIIRKKQHFWISRKKIFLDSSRKKHFN